MKIRSLHPSFFSDAKVCRLSPTARLLFAGLWCYADDYGRGEWLPKSIEGAVFPRDLVDIQALLGEVLRAGLVRLYTDGQDDFYEIPSWGDYQSPKYQSKTTVPNPETLENPYNTGPGQIGPSPAEILPGFAPGEGVGEGVGEGEGVLAPKTARDEVWDTLAELFGEPTTNTNRRLRGKVVKSLSSAGATGESLRERIRTWPLHFPDATLTETALEKHWDRLGRPPARASSIDVEAIEESQRERERMLRAEMLDADTRGLPA